MKVVINQQYGGFGLSVKAQQQLFDLKDPHMRWTSFKEYHQTETGEPKFGRMTKETEATLLEQLIYQDGIILDEHGQDSNRACPLLVQIVEKLGTEANGQHAKLILVEIPEGIEWKIDEYDGWESIHEEHRRWP